MTGPTIDAFIPLKGHSARVPGKNLRLFRGVPLFHVIVRTLQKSEQVDRIFIDTDSERIAASAASLGGVHVIRRRPELEGDDTSSTFSSRTSCRDTPMSSTHYKRTPPIRCSDLRRSMMPSPPTSKTMRAAACSPSRGTRLASIARTLRRSTTTPPS